MTEVIGVRFKQVGKIYYFSPNGVQMPCGGKVGIVETARGIECGEVALSNREIAGRRNCQTAENGDPRCQQRGPQAH